MSVLSLACLAAMLSPPAPARADSYALSSQTGGQAVVTPAGGPPPQDYGGVQGGYGASTSYGSVQSTSASCTGPISTVYAWQPDYTGEPPPQSVIVTQSCTANCNGQSYAVGSSPGPPTCDDGLQNTPDVSVTPVYDQRQDPPAFIETQVTGSCSGTHCTVMAGAAPLTIPCTPKAVVSLTDGPVHADVTYNVSVSPVTITPAGATLDSSRGWDILVGQGCSPTLTDIPGGCTVSNYQWSVTGTTFQSWTVSSDQSHTTEVDGPGPLNGPNPNSTPPVPAPHWYWNEKAHKETITCSATVTPPAGQGNSFTVTATQKVSVMEPTYVCTQVPGVSFVSADGTYLGTAGTATKYGHGDAWFCNVQTPALFGSGGSCNFTQIITPGRTHTYPTGTVTWSENGKTGLDTYWPYAAEEGDPLQTQSSGPPGWAGWAADNTQHRDGDSPATPLVNASKVVATSVSISESYNVYLMYLPPGTDVQPVPLHELDWNWAATQSEPAGGWASANGFDTGTVSSSNSQRQYSYPSWTRLEGASVGAGAYIRRREAMRTRTQAAPVAALAACVAVALASSTGAACADTVSMPTKHDKAALAARSSQGVSGPRTPATANPSIVVAPLSLTLPPGMVRLTPAQAKQATAAAQAGQQAYTEGDLVRAEADFRRSTQLDGINPDALVGLARTLEQEGKGYQAIGVYRYLLYPKQNWQTSLEEDITLRMHFSLLLSNDGQWAEAVSVYENTVGSGVTLGASFPVVNIRFNPDDVQPALFSAMAHLVMGITDSNRGEHENALTEYAAAERTQPGLAIVNYYYGQGPLGNGALGRSKTSVRDRSQAGPRRCESRRRTGVEVTAQACGNPSKRFNDRSGRPSYHGRAACCLGLSTP